MKLLTFLFIASALFIDPTKIAKINTLKAEAKKAYQASDFKTAIRKYQYLVDSLDVREDEVLLNLANAYFQSNDTTQARNKYQSLTQSSKNPLRSKAEQQLGVMENRAGKFEEALNHFKQAIKNDPSNEDARYNYELLKKKLEEKKKQEQQKQDQNKDKDQQQNKEQEQKDKQDQKKEEDKKKEEQNKDQQQKDQQDKKSEEQKKKEEQEQNKEQKENKDQEKKDTPPSVSDKLEKMEMSEEKAKMILEAMKNQEIQYLQQNKRKATKPKDKGKPDW